MAFTPEDGTGLANANSFVPLAFIQDYFADRPNAAVTASSDAELQSRAIIASEWLTGWPATIDAQWRDEPLQATQALAFPRTGMDTVPRPVMLAVCQLVGMQSDGVLLYRSPIELGGRKRVKAGSVEVENFEVKGANVAAAVATDYLWLKSALTAYLEYGGDVSDSSSADIPILTAKRRR